MREDVSGLQFIRLLRPVTYKLDYAGIDKNYYRGLSAEQIASLPEHSRIQLGERQSGFLAQEVEQAANSIGFKFTGVDKPANPESFYGLRYSEFVVPLVKAVQEQQAIIEKMQETIEMLKKEIELNKR